MITRLVMDGLFIAAIAVVLLGVRRRRIWLAVFSAAALMVATVLLGVLVG